MSWKLPEEQEFDTVMRFIADHAGDDVRRLSLDAPKYPHLDMAFVIDQIAGRRTAKIKLPQWAATQNIIYPPHLSMEQCSSQATALYKASLVTGNSLVDLTGGLGVDFSFMAKRCEQATYVERQELLCQIASHNFAQLGLRAQVKCCDAIEHLNSMTEPVETIYIDPARRDTLGNRVYGLGDCTPDVTQIIDLMMKKSRRVIIKLSPMLDVSQALRQLPHVSHVHLVSIDNECKELLLVIDEPHCTHSPIVHCVNNGNDFTYSLSDKPAMAPVWDGDPTAPLFLYEPNASVMKAGCHNHIAQRFQVAAISRDSHLFVSHCPLTDFPGRGFVVDTVTSMNKRDLRLHLQGITQANVATRNFPLHAPELARRLRLKDGGDIYIFATTLAGGQHILLICHKNNPSS